MEIKNIQYNIELRNIVSKTVGFLNRRETAVVFCMLFILVGYAGYLWYQYAYSYQWSEIKKQEYINAKSAMNSFDEVKFNEVLDNINNRQDLYQKNIDNIVDIFRLK